MNQLLTIYLKYKKMNLLCVDFIVSLLQLTEKTLLNYTNLLSSNDYKENGKITYKYFKNKYVKS